MKDCRLSEIVAHCKECQNHKEPCTYCGQTNEELHDFCASEFVAAPYGWEERMGDIEPRDMIDLPRKEHVFRKNGDFWIVYYRNIKYGCVDSYWFNTEAEADIFLADLKLKEIKK